MSGLTIVIPGHPRGWRQNHAGRVVGRGKVIVSSYLTLNAAEWQKDAIRRMRYAWGSRPPMDGALSLRVDGVWPRPARLDCQHKRQPCSCSPEVLAGEGLPYTSTPDATNVHKLAEDALTKSRVIEDDRLVCEYGGSARYAARGEDAHVRVSVEPAAGISRAHSLESALDLIGDAMRVLTVGEGARAMKERIREIISDAR